MRSWGYSHSLTPSSPALLHPDNYRERRGKRNQLLTSYYVAHVMSEVVYLNPVYESGGNFFGRYKYKLKSK